MPEYLAPGVFVEETSFRQKTIEGVGTSTAAFVGPTRFGPHEGLPEMLTSFGDFERVYGGVDELTFTDVDRPIRNYTAAAVRAFFENGGRRLYVSRVLDVPASTETASATIPETGAGLLRLAARHHGRAGNFQVTLTLRMGANILDLPTTGPTRLRGAEEYQVVWIDAIGAERGKLAYLHDVFDEAANAWTYGLHNDADGEDPIALVSRLDTTATSVVRVLTVDVEVGRLGRFLDPQLWTGLSLHPEHHNSLTEVFTEEADRATELLVPLVITPDGLIDGPAIAGVLLAESGAAAGLLPSTFTFETGGAITGAATLRFTPLEGGTADDVTIDFDATAADVQAELNDSQSTAAQTGPGSFTIGLPSPHSAVIQTTTLAVPGSASVDAGTRFSFTPTERFGLRIDGRTTVMMSRTASADTVDDAIEELVGIGNSSVVKASGELTVTLWGKHTYELEVISTAATAVTATKVTGLARVAAAGSFTIDVADIGVVAVDLDAADTAADLATALTVGVDRVTAEDELLIIDWTADAATVEVVDQSLLVAADGSAPAILEPISESLAGAGESAAIAVRLKDGIDGPFPGPDAWAGDAEGVDKSGLGAFTDLPDVSIVAAPGSTALYQPKPDDQLSQNARSVIGHLIGHCEQMRYRIAVVDSAPGQVASEVLALRGEFDSTHAALYYPWVTTYDPVTGRSQSFPPSGYVAGIYARNDITRGVHKAPANEIVNQAVGFETSVNFAQQELLNPAGVNCLRKLDQRGRRVWGARTMTSDPEWKYVNLRRYFAFLEASIDRGTQWAVFEPNGHLLWENVRRTVEDFLLNEFAGNRLLGATPEEAFFVRCDRATMTKNDLDNGRLVCIIGVSPLRPAEFVIFRIGQKTLDFVL